MYNTDEDISYDEYKKMFPKISYNDFISLKERDKIKRLLCEKQNVTLIEIPCLFYKIKLNDLKQFIYTECNNKNILIPNKFDETNIDISFIYNRQG